MRPRLLLLLPAAALVASCSHEPSGSDVFTWSGHVAPGAWLRLRNLNGTVLVARSDDDVVRLRATKRYKSGRPQPVRFEVTPAGSDVTVCALWGERGGTCTAERYASRGGHGSVVRRLFFREQPVNVEFVVALPAGVRLDASTVNGRVTVADVVGEVRVSTTNGSLVLAAIGGPVHARAVNGGIRVRLDSLAPDAEVEAETVNGSVTALAPSSLQGEIDLATVNGSVRSDFPLTGGMASGKKLHATLGAGGPKLTLRTVNGSVRLLRVGAEGAAAAEDEGAR